MLLSFHTLSDYSDTFWICGNITSVLYTLLFYSFSLCDVTFSLCSVTFSLCSYTCIFLLCCHTFSLWGDTFSLGGHTFVLYGDVNNSPCGILFHFVLIFFQEYLQTKQIHNFNSKLDMLINLAWNNYHPIQDSWPLTSNF